MEVVGATASIIAIIELAAKTASVVNDFRREYRDAPNEVKLLANQLDLIQSTLDSIGHLHDRNVLQSLQLPESLQASLQRGLVHAKSSISYTHQQCNLIRTKYKNTIKGRLSWASSDHKKILDLLQQLRDTQASLGVLLSLLQPVFQLLNQLELDQIKALLQEVIAHQCLVQDYKRQQDAITEAIQPHPSLQRRQLPQKFKGIFSLPQQWREHLGLDINLSKADVEKLVTYYLLMLQIQFPSIRGWKTLRSVFAINIGCPWYATSGSRAQIHINNIVPDNADSVRACEEGNAALLEALLDSGRASVRDVTRDSRPLLWYATNSGSTETVRLLLERHADATVITGPYHTELLSQAFFHRHVEISRLLIQNRVEIDHINSVGLTPLANLFNPGSTEPVCNELFDMLLCHGFGNLNVQDESGLTALHRAAAYGSAQDVRYLVRHGADATLKTNRHLWTPLFCAACYDNVETFRELLTVDKNSSMAIVSHVDLEGWTLLHVSASHGSFRVIPLLLEAGANPHALSMSTADDTVCTEVASRQVTPLDLVRAHYGSEGLKRFEEELRKAGLDTQYKDGDVFWSMDNALNKI